MTEIVTLDRVAKRYRDVAALSAVTLRLSRGESLALIGHNGAGKTTLMKLVLGLLRPSDGTVSVLGRDPAGRSGADIRRRIGFLPESVNFPAAMTGSELLDFYARLKGEPRRANAALLDQVGLSEVARRRVGTYSKGMRQRLALAQALIGEPSLLLLDEPTSGLDPESRAMVYDTIDRLRGRGATVLISTHALAEVEHHVDRMAMLHRGVVLADGSLAALRAETNLPLTVCLSVRTCTTRDVYACLGAYASILERDTNHLVLAVDPADKLTLIHDLARIRPWLLDLEIQSPGLDGLYRHLVARAEAAS